MFEFAERDSQTEITWIMHGKMPFLFRFMTKKTAAMISKDYDLGLAMLAGQLDPKAERPQLQFQDKMSFEPRLALCQSFSGGLKEMELAMQTSFPEMMAHLEKQKAQCISAPFTSYHKVNTKTMHFDCNMAVPVADGIKAGKYTLKTLGGGRYYKVTLKGRYDFLELAWYAAIAHVQMLKLKYDTKRASVEVYENDPREIKNSNDIETSIYVAIK
jgi:effector-binding domain-containing protein